MSSLGIAEIGCLEQSDSQGKPENSTGERPVRIVGVLNRMTGKMTGNIPCSLPVPKPRLSVLFEDQRRQHAVRREGETSASHSDPGVRGYYLRAGDGA